MHSPTLPPVDSDARAQALDPDSSFAVTAPAGSGKTGLLTQRMLTLLQRVEHPEELLAITFTKKAASEMQERILLALEAAEQPQPEDAHQLRAWQLAQQVLKRDRERGWQLKNNPQRLRIQTIDGLCRRIAAELPFASTLGAMPQPLDDADAAYREAVQNLFLSADDDAPHSLLLAQLFTHMDNNLPALESLCVSLLQKREQWLAAVFSASGNEARHVLEHTLEQIIGEHLQQLSQQLALFDSDMCLLMDAAARNVQDTDPGSAVTALVGIAALPGTSPADLPLWRCISDFFLTQKGTFRSALNVKSGFPPGKAGKPLKDRFATLAEAITQASPEAAPLLMQIHNLPDASYSDSEWDLLSALTGLLPRLVGELRLVFQRLGATDFTEITLAAIHALGDADAPSDLALKLDYQIKHILVDEFQDTALPQLQLLEKLTVGWQRGDGRSLFIVGDGMQSCYGFRNANVGLFLGARQHGIGQVALTPVELCVNFRSSSTIVDWVNTTFAEAFPAADDISRGAVGYTPSVAFNTGDGTSKVSVEVASYYSDSDREENQALPDKSAAELAEAKRVVALAKAARASYPEETVAILARTRGHLAEIIRMLNAEGVAFQANAMDALASRMAIVDLQSLTRALLLPDDRIAWLAILRAPWCGLDLFDLHAVATLTTDFSDARGNNLIWCVLQSEQLATQLSAAGAAIVRRVAPIVQLALEQRQRKSLRDWVYGTWLALGGPACLASDSEHEDVKQFFNLLERFDKAGVIEDWNAFNRALGQLYAAPMSNADERLQVMTLHKSKGLEFDTVIIPGLNRGSRGQDKSLLLWRERLSAEGEPQLLLGPLAKTGDDPGNLYQYLKQEQKQQDEYESTRLLYVGCTRAIKRLHLTACISAKADTALADLKPSGQLKNIWPSVSAEAQLIAVDAQSTPEVERTASSTLSRLLPDWQPPAAQDNLQLAHLRGKTLANKETDEKAIEEADKDNIPLRETREQRLWRHTGTVVHRALETLASAPLPDNNQEYIAAQQPLWRNYLYQQKLAGKALDEALQRINHAVAKMLTSEQGRWVLDYHHQQSQVEAEFFSLGADGFHRQHIVDRTFIADGWRWVIDYKTSLPEAEQTHAAFIAVQSHQYREQLDRYRLLFNHRPEPIKLALCFPLLESTEILAMVEP